MRRMPKRGHTRIQWTHREQKGSASLLVPAPIARLVGPDRLFAVELTDEGILYRFVEGGDPVRLPRWLTDD